MQDEGYWAKLATRRVGRRGALLGTAAAGSGVAAMATVGCGDDDDEVPSQAAQQPAEKQPKRGGTIVIEVTTGEAPHLDPHQTTTQLLSIRGPGIVYPRVIRRKLSPDINATTNIIPDGWLAQSWEQPDDNTYLFKLTPEAKWANVPPVNARRITAEDIAYSVTRQIAQRSNAAFIPGYDSVTAVDPATVRLRLKGPDPDFLMAYCGANNKVVAREAVELKGDLKEGPLVGVAWIMKEWQRSSNVTFVPDPDYWRKDKFGTKYPYVDRLELPRISDQSTLLAAFRARKLSNHPMGSKKEADDLKRELPSIVVFQEGGAYGPALPFLMRVDAPPFNDVRVRQALMKIVDRPTMFNLVETTGPERWAASMLNVNSDSQLLPEEEAKKILGRDVAEAKRLWQAAGVTNWQPEIFLYDTGAGTQTSATETFQQWMRTELGISSKITRIDNVKLTNNFTAGELPNVSGALVPGLIGINSWAQNFLRTGANQNNMKLSDPQLDSLIDAQAKELRNPGRRDDLVKQLLRRLGELATVWGLSIQGQGGTSVAWPEYQGLYRGRTNEPVYYEEVWIDQ